MREVHRLKRVGHETLRLYLGVQLGVNLWYLRISLYLLQLLEIVFVRVVGFWVLSTHPPLELVEVLFCLFQELGEQFRWKVVFISLGKNIIFLQQIPKLFVQHTCRPYSFLFVYGVQGLQNALILRILMHRVVHNIFIFVLESLY